MQADQIAEATGGDSPEDQTSTDISVYAPKGIPLEKIIDLRKKNLTTREIAAILGCHHTNVSRRLQAIADEVDTLPLYQSHKADVIALTGKRILNHLTNDKLEKASAYQLTGMFGIINQHERLERDKSTSNVAHVHQDIAALIEAEGK